MNGRLSSIVQAAANSNALVVSGGYSRKSSGAMRARSDAKGESMTERDRKKAIRALRQCWRVYSTAAKDRGSRRMLRAIEEAGKVMAALDKKAQP